MGKKIILAYSGGLDTSVAVKWLKDKGFDVVCYMADVGQGSDVGPAKKRALATGASKVIVGDLRKEFVEKFVWPSLKAGAVYESKYFLATALSHRATYCLNDVYLALAWRHECNHIHRWQVDAFGETPGIGYQGTH